MATLQLAHVWINLAATGAAVNAPSTGRANATEVGGEVRTYAGGRQRFIGTEADQRQVTVTLRQLTLAQVETLEAWRGRTVQIRDHRGQRFWCVYKAVQRIERKHPDLYDAAIVAHTVTITEGV